MKNLRAFSIILLMGYQSTVAQSVILQPNTLNTREISINNDGSVPKSRLHIKGVGNVPTVTQISGQAFTSITAEANPNTTSNEVFGVYGFSANSEIQNAGLFGLTNNTAIFNTGVLGLATFGGVNDNFGVKGYATNDNAGAAFGVYGTTFGYASARASYGVYGEAFGDGIKYAGYFDGNVTVVGTINMVSDSRFKTNINPLTSGLSEILKLKTYSYQYSNSAIKSLDNSTKHRGFLAQEVQQILPELVSRNVHPAKYDERTKVKISDSKEYLSINYLELIPILTRAIQEQQTMIEELKQEINLLKKK